MLVLFCHDPLMPSQADDAYAAEVAVVERLGIPYTLIDHDAIVKGLSEQAIRRVPSRDPITTGVYRGWMMTPEQYTSLYHGLNTRGVRLINDPGAYRHCHYLPESYAAIESSTPRTVWLPMAGDADFNEIMNVVRPFGDGPVVLKDYVKSQKHAWDEACFISSASDRAVVERVVNRFLELQGSDLAGGLVFREFVEFEPVGRHPRSGMPLTREYRLFYLDGRPLLRAEYWEEGDYSDDLPPVEHFTRIAAGVRSRFFTMDVARRKGGDWLVVELGDGQVAGMPEKADLDAFYRSLALAPNGFLGQFQ
jgi:ATP-grasp domain, R2K clade family 3